MENIIDNVIRSNAIFLQDSQTEYMCVLNSELLDKYTESWDYNRALDPNKIESIRDTIRDKDVLDTNLHFFYTTEDNKIICFDGNHRREALISLYKQENINIRVCCYIYICQNINNLTTEIYDKFKIINQMTPIPEIYIEILDNLEKNSQLLNRRDIIDRIYNEYKQKYHKFLSTSVKCRRPNFNDTKFKDLCNRLKFNTYEELVNALDKINIDNKQNINTYNLTSSMISKCEQYDFYLFI